MKTERRRPRLVVVTGHGGAGKTSVALALARRLIQERAPARVVRLTALGHELPSVGVPVTLLDGESALAEYLADTLPAGIGRHLMLNPVYSSFVDAAPGLGDLMILGKLAEDLRRHHETIVVDGPVTSLTLGLLGMARACAQAFGGWIRSECERLVGILGDPGVTRVLLVTRPEAEALRVTAGHHQALTGLGLALGTVIVNAVERSGPLSFPVPVVALPYCPRDPLDPAELDTLGRGLDAVLA